MRKLYVSQLTTQMQNKIKNDLIKYFKEDLELNEIHMQIELEMAMSSRVSDLEDTINIEYIINSD